MRAQAVPLTNAGNLVSGEGVIAPVADAGSIEALGDDSIVTKFKQLIDLCDQFGRRLLPSCYASVLSSDYGKSRHAGGHAR